MPHGLSIGRCAVPRIAAQAAYDNRKRQLRLCPTAETKTPVKNPPHGLVSQSSLSAKHDMQKIFRTRT
jgi:hypothetical protein